MTPELFAPGIVPTEDNEVLYGFFNNGVLFLFDRTPPDLKEWAPAVYRMDLKDEKWTPPNEMPYQGKPWYHYYTTAPEGEQVYFSWKGSLGGRTSSSDLNIWWVRKTAIGWTEPRKLPFPVNSIDLDTYPSVTEDRTLYFFSNREGGFGGHDIYRSRLIDGKHTTVENLSAPINTEYDELDPFIAPDESYLIFCSKTLDGYGGFDLYIAFQESDGRWTKPVNMGEGINSSAYDWVPYVTPDGKYFFFNSTRSGSWDIYWVDARIIGELKLKNRNLEESEPLMDQDGNVYRTIRIGDQIWMAENLKATHYRDGTPIPNVPDKDVWRDLRTGALCWLEDDPSSFKDVYGALYNYFAVADPRKLSPVGWHVPTIDEWLILENNLGGREVAGGKMKDIASNLWKNIHPGANNASGFSARPAGGRGRLGNPGDAGHYATWWASTSHDSDFAWHWGLFSDRGNIRSNPGHKASGFSVRCVKDQ